MGPHLGSRYMYMLYMKPVVTGLDQSMRKVFKTTCREFVRWICEEWIFCSYHWNMFFCSMENCCCSIVSIENFLSRGVSFGGTMASAICFKEKTMILQMHNTHIIVVTTWYHTSKKQKSFSLDMNTIKCYSMFFKTMHSDVVSNPFNFIFSQSQKPTYKPKDMYTKKTHRSIFKRGVDLQLDGAHLGNLVF